MSEEGYVTFSCVPQSAVVSETYGRVRWVDRPVPGHWPAVERVLQQRVMIQSYGESTATVTHEWRDVPVEAET